MKINSIKISNIFSFKHEEDIEKCPEIRFGNGLNILIGANGAGKSNFLEIINQLFSNSLFFNFQFNEQNILAFKNRTGTVNLKKTITKQEKTHSLVKNHQTENKIIQIKIEIGLTEKDKENLNFLHVYVKRINEIFAKYSNSNANFPTNVSTDELNKKDSISLIFQDPNSDGHLVNMTNFNDDVSKFILFYFQNFYGLQYLIYIANKEESENWPPLKNTFAMISSYRNYNTLDQNFTIQENENSALSQLKVNMLTERFRHSENKEPQVFSYVKHIIGYPFHYYLTDRGFLEKNQTGNFKDNSFIHLNNILKKTLGYKLDVERLSRNTLSYRFSFLKENTNERILIDELSGGEKGIIHFILSIFGYDLENGVMIIDEPEIHIHPQMQQQYLSLVFEAAERMKMQIIMATHSPEFVNSNTIDGCHRFYRDNDGFTNVLVPKLNNIERDLIRILDYTKATRVLFSDKVVMTEGDSDAYFYRFYYDYYKKDKKNFPSLEFQYIIGIDYYSEWKKFFDDWQIEAHFIRDKDGFGGTIQDIEQKYEQGIYILKRGKLEDYIGNEKSNKLGNAIDFCKSRFYKWMVDETNKEKVEELNKIFDKIVGKN